MSSLGIKGVHYDKHMDRYVGKMTINGVVYRRSFENKAEAISYRQSLEQQAKGVVQMCNQFVPKKVSLDGNNTVSTPVVTTKVINTPKVATGRPQNYCYRDEVIDYVYEKHSQRFSANNLTTGDFEVDAFSVAEVSFKLIRNKNATIVIFEDGSKGVAKCCSDDVFSRKTGLEWAYGRALCEHLKNKYSVK